MNIRLFTYGTLEIPEVMAAVTGRSFSSMAASAQGYGRYRLKKQIYPAMISEPGATTYGTLYMDIDAWSLARLDEYEDTCYHKMTIQVLTEDRRTLDAFACILPEQQRELISCQLWDRDAFIKNELVNYLSIIRG